MSDNGTLYYAPAFSVHGSPAAPAYLLSIHSGDNQTGTVLEALPQPLVVQVTDQSGNPPTTNIPITFSVTQQPPGVQTDAVLSNPNATVPSGSTTASTDFILGDAGGTYQVTASCASCTPQSVTFTENACSLTNINILPYAGGPPSLDWKPTSMNASFTPTDATGAVMTLADAAKACGFSKFDWVQIMDKSPGGVYAESDCLKAGGYVIQTGQFKGDCSVPITELKSPPPFLDPVPGGYTYFFILGYLPTNSHEPEAFPFYYSPLDLDIDHGEKTLLFFDAPTNKGCKTSAACFAFTTQLVGVCEASSPTCNPSGRSTPPFPPAPLAPPFPSAPLFQWKWESNFNGSTGGVYGVRTANFYAPDPGSGTGGVTITSINGVPQTPPSVSCSATPTTLWPPNGTSVVVTVSGSITPGTQAIPPSGTMYAVIDEYGQVQPSGSIALGVEGSYSFGVSLIAARNGNDQDGRQYTITVSAQDTLGNVGSCPAVVTVPHDQGQ